VVVDSSSEAALIERLRTVLGDQVPQRDLDRLVLDKLTRNRSSVYFVSVDGPVRDRRWVVKQPSVDFHQADLEPPMSAAAQFEAHRRLYEHLQQLDGPVRTPRPVGVMPDLNAYVMEFVTGSMVSSQITLPAVRSPDQLLSSMAASAEVLQAVHSLEPAQAELVQLADLENEARATAEAMIRSTGLRVPTKGFFAAPTTAAEVLTSGVVLHGDYAPENVIRAPSGSYCLDAALTEKGAAENDVVRFLTMLFQEKLFVVGAFLPPVQELRRRSAAAFLRAYYGERPWPETLQALMVLSLAARYKRRHVSTGSPSGLGKKQLLLPALKALDRQHFRRLLAEVSSPGWPHVLS
jgi:aminoglycoside phosphotransferase (APT) family kinase protein